MSETFGKYEPQNGNELPVVATDNELQSDEVSQAAEPLLDRDGKPVAGIGRLDQVIGAKAAKDFFDEREARIAYLRTRAIKKWGNIR